MSEVTTYQGKTTIIQVTVSDSTGAPFDLTDVELTWSLGYVGGYALLMLTSADDPAQVVIVDAAAGRIDITLDPSDTAAMLPGTYQHELAVQNDEGTFTAFSARFRLLPSLTEALP